MNELDEKSLELDNLTEADKNLMIEIFRRWVKNSITSFLGGSLLIILKEQKMNNGRYSSS